MASGRQRASTPVTRDPEGTRRRILAAALREFAARGFAGARVDAIARRARANKRMLYHYFGNKADLFREVLRRHTARKDRALEQAPGAPGECLLYWYAESAADLEGIRLMQWEALETAAGRRPIAEDERRAAFGRAVQRIGEQQARGLLPTGVDPAHLLLTLIGITTFPLAFPQVARLATGRDPSDPAFRERREACLRRIAACLGGEVASR